MVTTGFKSHRIKRGETLSTICRTYGINKTTLLKVNNLRSKKLTRGQYLRIPYNVASYQLLPEGSKVALAGNKSNLILHRIKAGESISQIATRYNVSPKEIVAWNNLGSANRISAGQQLALYPGNKTILTVPGELMAEAAEDDTSSIASSGKDSLQKTRVLTADKKKVTRSLAALPTGRTKTSTQVAGMKKNTVKIAQLDTVKTISTPAVQKRKSTSSGHSFPTSAGENRRHSDPHEKEDYRRQRHRRRQVQLV